MTPTTDPQGLLVALLAMITLGYFVTCAIWPFKPCRRCDGRGHFRSPFLRAVRLCRPCHGSGLRLRAGRKAINTYRRLHRRKRTDQQRQR